VWKGSSEPTSWHGVGYGAAPDGDLLLRAIADNYGKVNTAQLRAMFVRDQQRFGVDWEAAHRIGVLGRDGYGNLLRPAPVGRAARPALRGADSGENLGGEGPA
jgi:hypothetical protein